jgi:hypothetical protein
MMISSLFSRSDPSDSPSLRGDPIIDSLEENDTLMPDSTHDPVPSDDTPDSPIDVEENPTEVEEEEDPNQGDDSLDDSLRDPSGLVALGTDEDNFIFGFEGNDTLLGVGGHDVILGGDGDNVISGGSGDDVLRGGPGRDSLVGDSGDDVLGGDGGGDRLRGGAGRDIFLLQPQRPPQLNLSQFVARFEDFGPEAFPLNRLDQLINNPDQVDPEQLARFEDLNVLLEGNDLEGNELDEDDPDEDDPDEDDPDEDDPDERLDSETIIEDFDPTEDRLGLIGSLNFDDLEIRPSAEDETTVEIRRRDSGELLTRLLSNDPQLAEKITEETVVALDVVQFTQERLELDDAGNPVETVTLRRNRSSGNTIAVAITSRIATDSEGDSEGDSDTSESEPFDQRWVLFGPTEEEKTVQLMVDESLGQTVPEVNLQLETPLGGARLGPLDEAVLELFEPEPVEPTPRFVNLQRIRPLLGDDGTSLVALEVVLVRDGDLSDPAAVTVQLADGTTPTSTSLFGSLRADFEANRATTTVQIPLSEETARLEQVRLSLTEPSPGLQLGDDRQTLFELMPMPMDPVLLSFAESIFQVEEDGTPIMEVVLVRSGNLEQASQATITVSEGTLALPESFGDRLIPVTFEPGQERQTITITGVQQSELAAPGTVNLSLSNPSPGTELIRPRSAILEVFEVDPPPPDEPPQPEPPPPGSFGEIGFTSANYVVDEDGTQFAEIGLERRNGSTGEVAVTVIPFSQTAVAPADFDDTPIQVTFAEGQTQQVVRLPIIDDSLIEPSETLGLVLANPTNGASLGPVGSATLTIGPSDVPTMLSFEGVGHLNPVGGFYGAEGVQFSENALALLSATGLREMGVREGVGGNFETAPSGETAVSYNQGDRLLLTVQEGFTSQLSFAYASPFQEHQVTVFSGLEGTGEVLARLSLAQTPAGEFPRAYDVFETVTLPFAGVARSLSIGSVANKILLDDIVLG